MLRTLHNEIGRMRRKSIKIKHGSRIVMTAALLIGGSLSVPAAEPKPVADYRNVVKSTDVETYSRAAWALRKWMIANDPHRPIYHFTGPESWGNVDITVPANTTATVFVPAKDVAGVTESGKPAVQAGGVRLLRTADHAAVYVIGAGTYHFQSTPPEFHGQNLEFAPRTLGN
ncbi:MAG: hypothetical protein NTV49_07570 [Kiritimatiellaeota bacterium]|nr:hypothetical protein [Kiritimatiellota bacterium]